MKSNEKIHQAWMERCRELGLEALMARESPVGAIIVHKGKIVAEGKEASRAKKDITAHAEMEAIRAVRQNHPDIPLEECILVTTHEPCVMCSYAIRHHAFSTVIYDISTGEIGGIYGEFKVMTTEDIRRWYTPPVILKLES